MRIDRDAATVVPDGYRAVVVQDDLDSVTVPGERLVNGVVDDLVDEMMETASVRLPDVHRRTLLNGFKPLQHLYLSGAVFVILRHLIPVNACNCTVKKAPHARGKTDR